MSTLEVLRPRLERIEKQDRYILAKPKNEMKSDSREMTVEQLLRRLREEVNELTEAIDQKKVDLSLLECSDVRNFAMLLHDKIYLNEYQELLEFAVVEKFLPENTALMMDYNGEMHLGFKEYFQMGFMELQIENYSPEALLPVYTDYFEHTRFHFPVLFGKMIEALKAKKDLLKNLEL